MKWTHRSVILIQSLALAGSSTVIILQAESLIDWAEKFKAINVTLKQVMPIKTIIHFWNDNVAVCDENGEQMPQFQGCFDDVADAISAALHSQPDALVEIALTSQRDALRWEEVRKRHAHPS